MRTLIETYDMPPTSIVGRYLIQRYRKRVAQSGAGAVAKQLRKQGVPLAVARVIIFGQV